MLKKHHAAPRVRSARATLTLTGLALCALVAMMALAASAAQGSPSISLDSFNYRVGDTLTVRASGLRPGSDYTVTLTPPEGSDGEEATGEHEADAAGRLSIDFPLDHAGRWALRVAGPDLDATLNVQVAVGVSRLPSQAPAQAPDATAPPVTEEPAGEAPAGETETEAPGDTEGETPAEAPAESPAQTPVEAPAETPADAPAETSEPAQAETPAEAPSETPAETPSETPTEAPAEAPSETPAETAPSTPSDTEGTDAQEADVASETGLTEQEAAVEEQEAVQSPEQSVLETETPAETQDDIPASETPPTTETTPEVPESEATPQPILPGSTQATDFGINVALDNGSYVATLLGQPVWRLDFPLNSGASAEPLVVDDRAYLGRGNHVLVLNRATGNVLMRHRLPAQVVAIEAASLGTQPGAIDVTVEYSNGTRQDVAVSDAGPVLSLAFDPDPALYGWLRAEAQVADPVERLLVDPTNPWLYVAAAGSESTRAPTLLSGALARAQTFYERAQLARQLMSGADRRPDLAAQAMDAALEDFVDRGYRGTLLFDEATSAAYGFPLDAMRSALARGDMESADFWAPWLYRLSGSAVAANETVLRDYATELRRLGRDSEANTWRQRAGEGHGFNLANTLRGGAAALGRGGWLAVAALLVAILALNLTLAAKYWRPQSLLLRQNADRGRKPSPLARLNVVRHAAFVEKFVVVLLFGAVLALVGLHGWTQRAGALDARLGGGSLATPVARGLLAALPDNTSTAFVNAYAAQTSGDTTTAARLYQDLTDNADAMNNLGVLRNDDELFRLALSLRPNHPEASFNLGLSTDNPSRLLDAYRPSAPQLAAPGVARIEDAYAGGYRAALGAAFTNPWTTLTSDPAFGPQWLWTLAVVLFLLWALLSVIWFLIPRPRQSRNAPRTFLYHLLALLFPGTGLADELWGVLLLVPWAIFGTDLLRRYFLLGSGPVIPEQVAIIAMIVIYVINLVAFVVEYRSYRARMTRLKVTEPDVARAYGMRVADSPHV
ncbi:MAG: hypothetical protein KF813_11885 [Trueperaceae bacterium]|nr:hypothetical protein [Trueperaceae bacterium]